MITPDDLPQPAPPPEPAQVKQWIRNFITLSGLWLLGREKTEEFLEDLWG